MEKYIIRGQAGKRPGKRKKIPGLCPFPEVEVEEGNPSSILLFLSFPPHPCAHPGGQISIAG